MYKDVQELEAVSWPSEELRLGEEALEEVREAPKVHSVGYFFSLSGYEQYGVADGLGVMVEGVKALDGVGVGVDVLEGTGVLVGTFEGVGVGVGVGMRDGKGVGAAGGVQVGK